MTGLVPGRPVFRRAYSSQCRFFCPFAELHLRDTETEWSGGSDPRVISRVGNLVVWQFIRESVEPFRTFR